jgi:tRNA nucleotidyltransferase/poly(A) polymerase
MLKNLKTATLKLTIPNGKVFELDFVGLRKEVYDNPDSRVPTVTQATVEEDAMRRDLTINSLFYNINTNNIEDYVGGVRDIHRKVIRTPLDPIRTFNDDPLRILRALRFLCRFKFSLNEFTELAMENQEIKIKLGTIITRPRIGEEILGFFKVGSNPLLGFIKIYEKGLWNIIFGNEGDWGRESMVLISKLENKSLINMLATLTYPLYLKDIGKTFRLKEKTSVDICITVDLRLKNEIENIISKIHKCIYNIITILGVKNPTLWKPSDIALIIIDVEEYLNNMIEVGKTINEELFNIVNSFINCYNLQDSYKKQKFDSGLVSKYFELSDGRKLGVLLKILFAWQFDNPPGRFEEAIILKDRFLEQTEEITKVEEALFAERQKQKKEQNKKK